MSFQRRLLAVAAVVQLWACSGSTSDSDEAVKAPRRTFYTLRAAPRLTYERPLPARTDILVDWHYDDGTVQTYPGFRGWDFLGDGRFGMLEVLAEDGSVQEYIYDFAGDGRPRIKRDAVAGTVEGRP